MKQTLLTILFVICILGISLTGNCQVVHLVATPISPKSYSMTLDIPDTQLGNDELIKIKTVINEFHTPTSALNHLKASGFKIINFTTCYMPKGQQIFGIQTKELTFIYLLDRDEPQKIVVDKDKKK